MMARRKLLNKTSLEVFWILLPLLIVSGLVWPVVSRLSPLSQGVGPDITIRITGFQWGWRYEYMDASVQRDSFAGVQSPEARDVSVAHEVSGNQNHQPLSLVRPLVLPVGKPIRLISSAPHDGEIHTWWVPVLGVKLDAIPGLLREHKFRVDRLGVFRGQNGGTCSNNKRVMPVVVEVKSVADYEAWLKRQKLNFSGLHK